MRYGKASSSRRVAKVLSRSSRDLFTSEIALAEKAWPHNSSVTALTFPGRAPLDVHLRQRREERLLGALVAAEEFGREAAVAVLRHAQFQLADAGDERTRVGPRAISPSGIAALALRGAERVGHLRFEHLLQRGAHDLHEKVRVGKQRCFRERGRGGRLRLGHGRASWLRGGEVQHRHLAMATSTRGDFAELYEHYSAHPARTPGRRSAAFRVAVRSADDMRGGG